jgi:hypothetical protein
LITARKFVIEACRALVDHHGLAWCHQLEPGCGQVALRVGHRRHPLAHVAVEERGGQRGGAAADLAQPPLGL